jgi:hypothetical protein
MKLYHLPDVGRMNPRWSWAEIIVVRRLRSRWPACRHPLQQPDCHRGLLDDTSRIEFGELNLKMQQDERGGSEIRRQDFLTKQIGGW